MVDSDGKSAALPTERRAPARRARSPQKRSAQTRRRLIDATIACVARQGYQGASLADIAAAAGLSAGPRQYYFPTRADLMAAVWAEIVERAARGFAALDLSRADPRAGLRALVDAEIERSRRDEYLVDLELKLAIRGDPDLRAVLAPLIAQSERATDAWWLSLFRGLSKSRADLLAVRYMLTWLLRGLAIERVSGRDPVALARMEDELRTTVIRMMFDET